jgi:hypothetical protein
MFGPAGHSGDYAGILHGLFRFALQHRVAGHRNDVLDAGLGIQKVQQRKYGSTNPHSSSESIPPPFDGRTRVSRLLHFEKIVDPPHAFDNVAIIKCHFHVHAFFGMRA